MTPLKTLIMEINKRYGLFYGKEFSIHTRIHNNNQIIDLVKQYKVDGIE